MGSLRMQALNIDAAKKHAADISINYGPVSGGGTSTPFSLNTPDILNSLISITSNPFFEASSTSTAPLSQESHLTSGGGVDEDKKVFATLEVPQNVPNVPISPTISVIPATPAPSTVQSLRSQFIKDSLKLTIQTKRKCSGKEEFDVKADLEIKVRKKEELTPEDEERRRRRRDRNKIAATKCRNKKKEKTGLLVQESHMLESTNITLKGEISKYEEERQRLAEILATHASSCTIKSNINDMHENMSNFDGSLSTKRDFNLANTSASRHYHHLQQPLRRHLPAQRS